jgi:hypothetical protein
MSTQLLGTCGREGVIKKTKYVNTEWYKWHTNIAEDNMKARKR